MLLFARHAFALDPSLDVSQYAHTAWRVRDGFTKGGINELTQTPDGYLWLGTDFGVYRFDGVRAIPWQPPNGEQLPSNRITCLATARDGTLWIATDKGLASWKDGKLRTYPELAGQALNALLVARNGTVWVGIYSPGRLCAVQGGKVRCYSEGSFGAWLEQLYEDHKGNLWVAAANGVWKWDSAAPQHYALGALETEGIIEGDSGELLVGTSNGLKQIVGGRVRAYTLPGFTGDFFLFRALFRSSDGSLWIGTNQELVHLHQGRIDMFGVADGLSGDRPYYLFEDREGSIWVATSIGLDRFREYVIPAVTRSQGLSTREVWGVQALPDGTVWLSTSNGLNKWRNGHVTIYPTHADGQIAGKLSRHLEERLNGTPRGFGLDDQDRLWASIEDGIFYFDQDRFIRVPGVPGGNIWSITGDGRGKLWVDNGSEGLFHVAPGKAAERIPWSHFGRKTFGARSVLPDRSDGSVWLGFWDGGIVHFRDGEVRASYTAEDGLGSGRVDGLRFGSRGTLWASTEGGLSLIREGGIQTLTSKNGLPCDIVHWSIEDDDHFHWLYMACGLVRIAGSEVDAWVSDPNRKVRLTTFDASDGVLTLRVVNGYAPRVTKAADGKIWFVTYDGISVLDPRHLPTNMLPPPVHIEKVIADGKTYDVADGVHLPALIRNLTIDYTALSLVVPEKVHFRFRLEGQDRDWREVVNDREVQYTNLPPKHYKFRVLACNNSGVWNEEGATLDFVIPPAWYQTNWFRGLCVAAFLAFLWGLYQLRIHQVRKEEEKFREAVETMPALAFVASVDGDRTFVNKGWVEYTGLPAQQALGSGWQAAVHPDDLQRVQEKWGTAIAMGAPFEYELRLRHGASGDYRWFQKRVVPLRNKRGKVLKWCGLETDIEDRKRAEQLQADLAHTNRVTMLGELAASISHELKQPITATITNARVGVRWLKREHPDLDEVLQAVQRIEKDGARATEIIDRLRALYKKAPPKRELVDVNEIIEEMAVMLRGEANRSAVSIRTDLAASPPSITADRVQLQQVLMNLMLNGIEAMNETGGVLTISSQPENEHLVISVSDTGVGLPPGKADKIFDAFFTTKPQGSGMGLAISRSIAESHAGRLWATPNDGRGASFHFSLPTTSPVPEEARR